jgi:xanthine dehydrogenase YagS FAD-binding subunit
MNLFEYHRPSTIAEAVAAWQPGAAYLGGGTNLVDLMKIGVAQPSKLIDISRLPDLGRIETLPDGAVRIGALVRNADLAHHPELARSFPIVAEALLAGASAQVRNMATIGGNLMQGTRCPYFQDSYSDCNRRVPGSGCAALGGVNGSMAILGWSDACIATNPSDLAVALAALGAVVETVGRKGRRGIPFDEFYRLPGATPEKDTQLEAGELIVAVSLPAAAAAFRHHARYLKVRERTSFAFALASAAAALRIDDGRIVEARLALGGVAARPWRVAAAEAVMAGRPPATELFARAAAILLDGARPSGENGYKIELARRTTIRALTMAAAGTPSRVPALPASPFGESHDA